MGPRLLDRVESVARLLDGEPLALQNSRNEASDRVVVDDEGALARLIGHFDTVLNSLSADTIRH